MRSLGIRTELLQNLSKNSLHKLVKNENPNRSPVTINNFHISFEGDVDEVIPPGVLIFFWVTFQLHEIPKNAKKIR